jgi:hypothetical protein
VPKPKKALFCLENKIKHNNMAQAHMEHVDAAFSSENVKD